MKLSQGKFMLDIWKSFFTESVVGPWNKLPGKWSQQPRLSEFKEPQDDAVSHMVYFQVLL